MRWHLQIIFEVSRGCFRLDGLIMSNSGDEPAGGGDEELAGDPPPLPDDPDQAMEATRPYDPETDRGSDADFELDSAVSGEKPPKSLGKYTIKGPIGAGGMGVDLF